ncbi:hypothetical protein [Streptomyces hirsutus]|uniref:hypothetical protein n=1 Tax=Streptomyces hirsutus TaxID=35620 RepID=UPI003669BA0B
MTCVSKVAQAQFQRLFPLHDRCNAHCDLVPARVDPAVVNYVVFVLLATAVLLWFGVARLAGRGASGSAVR